MNDIRAGLSPLVNLVYPPRCPACGVAIAEHGGLCVDCWSALEEPGEPRDEGVVAPWVYNAMSRGLVLSLKHGGKTALARLMGRMMANKLDDAVVGEEPVLVPVPLHRLRLLERGYNQAALLARELERCGKGRLCVDALERRKRTPSLGGLGKEARRTALRGAIALRPDRVRSVRNRAVLLVDDVFTSGATSSACVDALVKGGARCIKVVCFTRVTDT